MKPFQKKIVALKAKKKKRRQSFSFLFFCTTKNKTKKKKKDHSPFISRLFPKPRSPPPFFFLLTKIEIS